MKITMINHASLMLEAKNFSLLQDPWISGGVFNDSWKLDYITPEEILAKAIKKATHIYISHEHPDHFNIPALKMIYQENKNIVFLIQDLPRKEVLKAINSFGFKNVIECKHREFITVGEVRLYMYSIFPLDSALAVIADNLKFLNLNDVELSSYDLRSIKSDVGPVDILFNQFSFATYNGSLNIEKTLSRVKNKVLTSFVNSSKFLNANLSIPFASFSFFSQEDNCFLNKYRYDIDDFILDTQKSDLNTLKMLPGDTITLGDAGRYILNKCNDYQKNQLKPDPLAIVERADIEGAFFKSKKLLDALFPKFLIWIIGDISVYCPDLKSKFRLNFYQGKFSVDSNKDSFDLKIYSQPLFYALNYSWGMQSLTIGGRVLVYSKSINFMYLRILFALSNSNIGLNNSQIYRYFFKNFTRISYQIISCIGYALKNFK